MPKRNRRTKQHLEDLFCSFELEVTRFAPQYSLYAHPFPERTRKWDPEPVSEYAQVEIQTRIREPAKYKGRCLSLSVVGNREMPEMIRSGLSQEDTPPSIGYYDLRGGNAQAYCRVPYDALPVIIAALASGHTRRLDLRGRAPRYGRGSLLDIALGLEEEEEPQAQTSVAPSPPEIIGS